MKDKKIVVSIIFALITGSLLVYVASAGRFEKKKEANPQEIISDTKNLTAQVQQLKDLLHAVVQLNQKLDASLQKEKGERPHLEKALKEAALQNKSLLEELSQAQVALALTQPIKQKINEIETALADVRIEPAQEKEIQRQLQDIHQKISAVDSQIPLFLQENKSYKEDAQNLRGLLAREEEEADGFKSQLQTRQKENQTLKENLNNVSEELKKIRDAHSVLEINTAERQKRQKELTRANTSLNKELRSLTQSLGDTQTKLLAARKEKETLLQELDATGHALAAMQKLKTEKETLQKQLAKSQDEKQNLLKGSAAAAGALKDIQKLQSEIQNLKNQLEQLTTTYGQLQNAYAGVKETIAQNEIELGKRANKILIAAEQQAGADARLSEIQAKAKQMEKESALLREQNVAVLLERESLRLLLNQEKLRLSELEGQASLISAILKGAKPAENLRPKEETQKIELELYPVKNTEAARENQEITNETPVEKDNSALLP